MKALEKRESWRDSAEDLVEAVLRDIIKIRQLLGTSTKRFEVDLDLLNAEGDQSRLDFGLDQSLQAAVEAQVKSAVPAGTLVLWDYLRTYYELGRTAESGNRFSAICAVANLLRHGLLPAGSRLTRLSPVELALLFSLPATCLNVTLTTQAQQNLFASANALKNEKQKAEALRRGRAMVDTAASVFAAKHRKAMPDLPEEIEEFLDSSRMLSPQLEKADFRPGQIAACMRALRQFGEKKNNQHAMVVLVLLLYTPLRVKDIMKARTRWLSDLGTQCMLCAGPEDDATRKRNDVIHCTVPDVIFSWLENVSAGQEYIISDDANDRMRAEDAARNFLKSHLMVPGVVDHMRAPRRVYATMQERCSGSLIDAATAMHHAHPSTTMRYITSAVSDEDYKEWLQGPLFIQTEERVEETSTG